MRVLIDLDPGDPRRGLAVDEALLESARGGAPDTLRLWVNDRAAIVGRSQAIEDEIDRVFAEREGIPVLRRISGGGAVYHYSGNLNLSVILHDARTVGSVAEVFRLLGGAVAEALVEFCPKISFADNDLLIGAVKVGGAAQARRGDALLYHTTVLVRPVDIPMERVLLALRSDYRAPRVPSRPRATISLSETTDRDLSMADVAAQLAPAIARRLGTSLVPAPLTHEEEARVDRLAKTKYNDSSWNRSAQTTKP